MIRLCHLCSVHVSDDYERLSAFYVLKVKIKSLEDLLYFFFNIHLISCLFNVFFNNLTVHLLQLTLYHTRAVCPSFSIPQQRPESIYNYIFAAFLRLIYKSLVTSLFLCAAFIVPYGFPSATFGGRNVCQYRNWKV